VPRVVRETHSTGRIRPTTPSGSLWRTYRGAGMRSRYTRKAVSTQCIAHVQDTAKSESRRVVKFPTSFVAECCYWIAEYVILIEPNRKTRRHGVGCTLTWDQHTCASLSRGIAGRACEKIHSLSWNGSGFGAGARIKPVRWMRKRSRLNRPALFTRSVNNAPNAPYYAGNA
jgi:hypothetical protein